MDIIENNQKNAELFIKSGLFVLKNEYNVVPLDLEGYTDLSVNGMNFDIAHYSIEGVGHLQTMLVKPGAPIQMATFTLTPYYKNLPMLSCDYMYMGEKRVDIMEVYELVADREAAEFKKSMAEYKAIFDSLADIPSLPSAPYWADSIRPVFINKNSTPEQDDTMMDAFIDVIKQFISDEKALPLLDEEAQKEKHAITAEYVENLAKQGGVSTDMWKAAYGEDFVRGFFRKIFFGVE